MSAEYINPQWRLPNKKTGNNQDYSMSFDGTQAIEIPAGTAATDLTGSNTIAAWVKRDETESNHNIVNKRGNTGTQYAFFIETTDKLGFDDGGDPKAYSNSTIPANVWTHVAVVIEAPGCTFYINGVADGGVSSGISVGPNASVITYIGKKYTGAFTLNGKLSQVCFFDYALPATGTNSIATLYNGGNPFNPMALPSPPIGYYPLGNSAHMGTNYLTPNGALQDYVFDFIPNDSIDTNFTLPNYSSYSIGVWYKKTGEPGEMPTGGDYFLWGNYTSGTAATARTSVRFNGANKLRIITGNDTVAFQADLNVSTLLLDGKWHHILTTTVSGEIKLYIDGNLQATHTNSAIVTGIVAGTSYKIGQSGYNTAYLDESLLSNFQIFDTALIGPEAQTLYNYGSPIKTLTDIPQSSNIKVWYKLDASEIYNSSSTEWEVNDATATYNSSSFVIPIPNQNTQQIQVNNFAGLTGASAGSWSFWYNTQDFNNLTINGGWFNGGQARWIGPYGTPHTGYTNTGEFNIYTSDGTQRASIAASYGRRIFIDAPAGGQLDKWAHFVGTYDGSNLRVYMNGEQVGTGTGVTEFAATGTLTTNSIRFGGAYSYNNAYDAKFSNGSVWNKTLTLAEIVEIYNNGKPKSLSSHSAVSNLVSWWKLDNLTTGLVDSIGGYNATLVGSNSDVSSGSVSVFNGESSGMSQSNLVTSDLLTTSSYSPYAMNFNGSNDYLEGAGSVITGNNTRTVSCWMKSTSTTLQTLFSLGAITGATSASKFAVVTRGSYADEIRVYTLGTTAILTYSGVNLYDDNWHNVVVTYSAQSYALYIDGIAQGTTNTGQDLVTESGFSIGRWHNANWMNGSLSNVSAWNTALTSAQVSEIYNQGLPSDLNSHSAYSNLVSWWQLGSNSSYASGWTCLDEKGSNNATSTGMLENAIVNGVETSGNGTSTNMGTATNISGSSPNGEGNSLSVNMTVANLTTGVV